MHKLDSKAVWLFFFGYILKWLGVFMVITVYAVAVTASSDVDLLGPLWKFFLFLTIFLYIWARLSYHYYRYELTPQGFKKEYGVIYKKYVTIPYERIQNVDIYRGILDRLLGLSDLHVQTAGMSHVRKYGWVSEGRLPGLSKAEAEKMRDELISRAKSNPGI